jgi:hypothetical protein
VQLYPRRRSVGHAANPNRVEHFILAQLYPHSATTRYERNKFD